MDSFVRKKQVLCLGAYRTGSSSLAQALADLGYQQVYHTYLFSHNCPRDVVLSEVTRMFRTFEEICDATLSVLPSYNANGYTREQFDAIFGPNEVICDVAAFAEPLIRAYPEAKVILVHRDFESWATSFLHNFVAPWDSPRARLSGWIMEPLLGFCTTKSVYKLAMGWTGVSTHRNLLNRKALRAAYDAHYNKVRRLVPPEQLLEIHLKELSWGPLCDFLGGKPRPVHPFPRLNDSEAYKQSTRDVHNFAIILGLLKIAVALLFPLVGVWMGSWLGARGLAAQVGDVMVLKCIFGGLGLLLGVWWALTKAKPGKV